MMSDSRELFEAACLPLEKIIVSRPLRMGLLVGLLHSMNKLIIHSQHLRGGHVAESECEGPSAPEVHEFWRLQAIDTSEILTVNR